MWVQAGIGPPSYAPRLRTPAPLPSRQRPWCQNIPPLEKKGKPEQLKTSLQLLLARLPPLDPSYTNPGCSFGISALVPLRDGGLNWALSRHRDLLMTGGREASPRNPCACCAISRQAHVSAHARTTVFTRVPSTGFLHAKAAVPKMSQKMDPQQLPT